MIHSNFNKIVKSACLYGADLQISKRQQLIAETADASFEQTHTKHICWANKPKFEFFWKRSFFHLSFSKTVYFILFYLSIWATWTGFPFAAAYLIFLTDEKKKNKWWRHISEVNSAANSDNIVSQSDDKFQAMTRLLFK